jgi:tetratricopeptide (TPR) repeat protein
MRVDATEQAKQIIRAARYPRKRVWKIGVLLLAFAVLFFLAWRRHREATLMAAARAASHAGDWERVERSLARLAWYGPLDHAALRLRIFAAMQRDDVVAAAALLEQVDGSAAEIAAARLEQGRILQEQGRLRAAAVAYRGALEHAPASNSARKALIGLLGLERRGGEQAEQLWMMVEQGGARPEARVEALCLLARGGPVIPVGTLVRGADEGTVLRRCLEVEPDNQHARAALAYFLRNRGQLDEARRLLEPWYLERGDQPPVGDEYLALLLDEGRMEEAGSMLTSNSPRRAMLRGIWLAMQGKPDEAVAAFQESVRRDPANPEPHHRLAQALRAVGRAQEATTQLEWVEDSRTLVQIVSSIDYAAPSPAAIARAEQLCRKMSRDREADAWKSLAEPEKIAAPGPRR